MSSRRRARCLCCGELFKADARNRGRQKYCSAPPCRRASKAASQRRWLAKPENEDYFRGPENAARVRRWQRAHPGYWRRTGGSEGSLLQDPCKAQAVDTTKDTATLLLQDLLALQGPMLLGLIATLTDSVLQEDIAATTRRLLQLGQDILAGRVSNARQTGASP